MGLSEQYLKNVAYFINLNTVKPVDRLKKGCVPVLKGRQSYEDIFLTNKIIEDVEVYDKSIENFIKNEFSRFQNLNFKENNAKLYCNDQNKYINIPLIPLNNFEYELDKSKRISIRKHDYDTEILSGIISIEQLKFDLMKMLIDGIKKKSIRQFLKVMMAKRYSRIIFR